MNITTLARIVARKMNITVINDDRASTFSIGRMPAGDLYIRCPARMLAPPENRRHQAEIILRGGIAHEALGHGHHTDLEAMEGLTKFEASMLNIIEDIRIERLGPEIYPGARVSLKRMAQLLESEYGFWNYRDERMGPEQAFSMAILRRFRTNILYQELPEHPTQLFEHKAKSMFGETRYNAAMKAARKGCFSASTADAVVAAKRAVAILAVDEPPVDSLPPASAPDATQDGDDPAGNDGGQESGDTQTSSDSTTSNGADDEGSSGEDAAEGGDAGDESGGENGSDDGSDGDAGDAPGVANGCDEGDQDNGDAEGGQQNGAMDSWPDSDGGDSSRSSGDDSSQETRACIDKNVSVDAGVGDFGDLLGGLVDACPLKLSSVTDSSSLIDVDSAELAQDAGYDECNARRIVRLLHSRLGASLTAIAEDEDDAIADRGRLDVSRLAGIASGYETRPFTEEGEPGRNLATDLFILFDRSGSMNGLNVDFLRQTILAVGSSLARFAPQVRFDLAWFNTSPTLVHRHQQRWTPKRGRVIARQYQATGGTDWPASAFACLPYFDDRSPRRKVLLTITDGHLGDISQQQMVLSEARAANVECAVVSVNLPLPSHFHGCRCEMTGESFTEAVHHVLMQCMGGQYR